MSKYRWWNVSEKLPGNTADVLVLREGQALPQVGYYSDANAAWRVWCNTPWQEHDNIKTVTDVIYWCPFPKDLPDGSTLN